MIFPAQAAVSAPIVGGAVLVDMGFNRRGRFYPDGTRAFVDVKRISRTALHLHHIARHHLLFRAGVFARCIIAR